MIDSYELGKQLINCKKWLNYRRVWVFVLRAWWNKREFEGLADFFAATPLRQRIIARQPDIYIQLLRQVLYRGTSTADRFTMITEHFLALEELLKEETLQKLYVDEAEIVLWHDCLREQEYAMRLLFRTDEIREGLLTLSFTQNDVSLYHINFSLVQGGNGQLEILIGALQGHQGASEIYKEMTKAFFGYRPKNLILYALRSLGQKLGVKEIRAVSNYGFQANNHRFRRNRKLKTSLDDFWLQAEGVLAEDRRFFQLPVTEKRKTIEEISTHKRNLYRKRFAVLDKMEADINAVVSLHMPAKD